MKHINLVFILLAVVASLCTSRPHTDFIGLHIWGLNLPKNKYNL